MPKNNTLDDTQQFQEQRATRISSYAGKNDLLDSGRNFLLASLKESYSYNFSWLGLPIIQYPQDIVALQEIMWRTQPDLVIETGVARGGSLLLYASILEMINGTGSVVGIDIDIRRHNHKRIAEHPLSHRIHLVENSSIAQETLDAISPFMEGKKRIMVSLDSNHTHAHVLEELRLYAPLVSVGCYCVVFDTVVEEMAAGSFPDRPWDKGDNPRTAVNEFLRENDNFVVDTEIDRKLIISAAPSGYLLRQK